MKAYVVMGREGEGKRGDGEGGREAIMGRG